MGDPALLRTVGAPLRGASGTTYDQPARLRSYLRRYAAAFPGASRDVASGDLVTGYHDAVEAIVRALERADGDPGRLRAELGGLRTELLAGPVRLDANGQAVVAPSLVRLTRDGAIERIGRPPAVDQSIGGRLPASLSPDSRPVACRSGGDGDAPGEAGVVGAGGEPAGTQAAPD
jgi:hypothetical protein